MANLFRASLAQLAAWFPIKWVNKCGIPVLETISVTTDTDASSISYRICPWKFRQLPCSGLFLLRVNQAPADGSDAFTVSLNVSPTTTATGTTTGGALLNSSLEPVTGAEVVLRGVYLVYYNKSTGEFILVNHIPATAAAVEAAMA